MNRRDILKGAFVVAASTPAVALAPSTGKLLDMNDFLARASPHELAQYHAEALAKAMNQINSGAYRAEVNHAGGFALIVNDDWRKITNS